MTTHDTTLALAVERHDAQATPAPTEPDLRDVAMDRVVEDWTTNTVLTADSQGIGYWTDGPYDLASTATDVVLDLIATHLDARAAELPLGLVRSAWADAANAVRDLIPTTPEGHAA